jgi:hypothetical protein
MLGFSTQLLRSGSIDEIVERTKHYVLAGKAGNTPFSFFFNNIAPNTPGENIAAVIAAIDMYGEPGANESTKFTAPGKETFLKNKIENNNESYTFKWLNKSGYSHLAK